MAAIAKLFMEGDDQIVLLPDEFRFESYEVRITIDGDQVILEPIVQSADEIPTTETPAPNT